MSWNRKMLIGVSLLVNSCFRNRIEKGFYIALWPATKNGSTTIIPSIENHEEFPDMSVRRRSGQIFTVPRLCSSFGGTSSVWCIMSCWNRVKPSQGVGIARNWCVWAEYWRRNGHSTKSDTTKLSSSMTMLGHMSQDRSRHTWKRWIRLPFVSIDGTRPDSSAFRLLWRSQKMDRFVDRLKRRIVFSRWYLTIARMMEKSSG